MVQLAPYQRLLNYTAQFCVVIQYRRKSLKVALHLVGNHHWIWQGFIVCSTSIQFLERINHLHLAIHLTVIQILRQ